MSALRPLESTRRIVTFFSFWLFFTLYGYYNITQIKAVSAEALFMTFLGPAVLAVVIAPMVIQINNRATVHILLTVMRAAIDGFAMMLGVAGILITYQWYQSPTASHLEPLLLLVGYCGGAAILSRVKILKIHTIIINKTLKVG